MHRLLFVSLILYCLATPPPRANAEIIKLNFTGEAIFTSGAFADEVVPNNLVTGAVYFDTTSPAIRVQNAIDDAQLSYIDNKINAPAYGVEVQYGSESHTTVTNSAASSINVEFRESNNPSGYDDSLFFTHAIGNGPGDDFVSFQLAGDGLITTGIPDSITFELVDGLDLVTALNNIDLGFGGSVQSEYWAFDDEFNRLGDLRWNVTSINAELLPPDADTDSDGAPDDIDNCTEAPNPDQIDANGDGIGNACDADLNNDCSVNFLDLGLMKQVFFTANADADLNGDGNANFLDLGIMKADFFSPPGPSGIPNACD